MHPTASFRKPYDKYAGLRKPIVIDVKERIPHARPTRSHRNRRAYVRTKAVALD